jgi:hypothetical protein
VAKVLAALAIGEQVRQEQPLIGFNALLVLQRPLRFRRQLVSAWEEPRRHGGRLDQEAIDAHVSASIIGDPVVNGRGIRSEHGARPSFAGARHG